MWSDVDLRTREQRHHGAACDSRQPCGPLLMARLP